MTDEIARASGQVGIFEAERLRYRVVRLVIGRGLFGWPATLAVFACLAVVGSNWLSNYLDDDDTIATLVAIWLPVVIIGFAGLVVLRGLKGRNHRAWYARGVPKKIELAYAVTDAGLRVRSELYDSTIYWQSFNEVSLAGDSWLLLNAGCAY